MDPAILELAERAGIDNMRDRIATTQALRQEANVTLTLFLSGAGGGLSIFVAALSDNSHLNASALVVSLYLFALAGFLTWKCLRFDSYPACFNEPKNLLNEDLSLAEIRRFELDNLQERIERAVEANNRRGSVLNWCRLLAAITPVIGFLGYLFSRFFCGA